METGMQLPARAPSDAFSLGEADDQAQLAVEPAEAHALNQKQLAMPQTQSVVTSAPPLYEQQQQQPDRLPQNDSHPPATFDDAPDGPKPPDAAAAANQMQQTHQQQHHQIDKQLLPPGVPAPAQNHQQQHTHEDQDATQAQNQPDHQQQQSSTPQGDLLTSAADLSQEQKQQQPEQQQQQKPTSLTVVLEQLANNADAISATEDVLRHLLAKQASLHHLGRKLEQHQVLLALQPHPQLLGFNKGRSVAAVMLFRCLQHWGLLQQTEPCPFLEQLSVLLQQQLDLEDESAPAEVAGLQCHVAHCLTLAAVLYCLLFKTTCPQLAAAAARNLSGQRHPPTAAEVMAAARRKVAETWQQGVAHMSPGLQAFGKLKFSNWGFKRPGDQAAAAAAHGHLAAASSASSSSNPLKQQQQPIHAAAAAAAGALLHSGDATTMTDPAGSAGASAPTTGTPGTPATAVGATAAAGDGSSGGGGGGGMTAPAPITAFMVCLDGIVQHSFVLLRDQLKRRLTPLLADCVTPDNDDILGSSSSNNNSRRVSSSINGELPTPSQSADLPAAAALSSAGSDPQQQQQLEQQQTNSGVLEGRSEAPAAGAGGFAAVAGAAAASAVHAEAALLNYRSWSELVGVLHAALVALRESHVPRALRSALMQQVLEFVNCHLFNQLLLRPECCSVSNARYALRGLKQLDTWILAEQSASHSAAHGPSSSIHMQGGYTSSAAANTAAIDALLPQRTAEQQQQQQQEKAPGAAAAAAEGDDGAGRAAAAAAREDAGWVQVPADTGEFDNWQPPPLPQRQRHQQQQQHECQQDSCLEQPELGPEAWSTLSQLRQALQFLVLENKGGLSLQDLIEHLCPALTHQQLYRLCTTAWQEETGSAAGAGGGVSGEVLEQMKKLYTLSTNGGLIVTFLLDEPTSHPPFVTNTAFNAAATASPGSATAVAAAAADVDGSFTTSSNSFRCRAEAVVLWDDRRNYGAGLRPIPAKLVDKGCPAEVFGFLSVDQHWPLYDVRCSCGV